ncbi:50S ribosomal protein L16 [Candidatus Falkowbacteria bacterium]|nr:50S ribosomal protein L16 [Candidatus Falkowbacteria bacterium]
MLMPKKVKHRKMFKGRRRSKGVATRKTELSFGSFGLRSMGYAWITARQIEAVRRTLIRALKKGGKIWIRLFPDKPVTTKGNEIPMGGGKGSVDHYVVPVKPGMVLFEMDGVTAEAAKEVMRLASHKLPMKTTFVSK